MEIKITDIVREAAPALRVLVFEADVINKESSDALTGAIESEGERLRRIFRIEDVNKRPSIRATREAYKKLGKDPNRYRPSAEALTRRIIQGKGLYRVNEIVDAINLISLHTGFSIGGFDADKISGTSLALGRGEEGEDFEGIGRGKLNICGLPVYRDGLGGIGTPTSDCERTKLSLSTRRLLMIVNMYGMEDETVEEVREYCENVLREYCAAENIVCRLVEA